MVQPDRRRRLGDQVVRRPRVRELRPVVVQLTPPRHPSRLVTSPLIFLVGFAGLFAVGTALLMLPIATATGEVPPFSTALFTAVSAATVTGLVVVETATYWSFWGQLVILLLIAVGGLGFMTLATFFLIMLGQRITLQERLLMRETLAVSQLGGLVRLVRNVVLMVTGVYLVGAALLLIRLVEHYPILDAVWYALFHAVSAFNNAGFAILPDTQSVAAFASDISFLTLMMVLMALGGISYTVIVDIVRHRRFSRLTLDSQLVLVTSLLLWLTGFTVFFIGEFANPDTLGPLGLPNAVVNSFFHSVSARTAGFSTVDFGATRDYTNLFVGFLMFVGGASGSVAGGIKVNTFAVIMVAVWASIKGRARVEAYRREIPLDQVQRALTVATLSVVVVFVTAMLLTFTEPFDFNRIVFETLSAFGTAGLSTGITPGLSEAGRYILVALMYVGRLGPLTLALALAPRQERTLYRFAEERVKIG